MDVIEINSEFIELDKLLKWAGIAETGGQARFIIDQGKVSVNGVVVSERRKKIFPRTVISCGDMQFSVERAIKTDHL